MAPPGRRRTLPTRLSSFLTLLFLLFVPQVAAQSAVLGIDLGTEYIKAALVKPGIPLDIVLTKDSKRKETSAIGFKPSVSGSQDESTLAERLYGADALAIQPRFPTDVYPNLKPLLGSVLDTKAAEDRYRAIYPALDLVRDGESSLGFKNKAFGSDDTPMSVEELLAMQLSNVKHNAEVMAGKGLAISNAVITVPTFFTVDERRAVELGAELAGLNVMSLVSDGLAVGLHYATSRNFPNIDQGEKPEHHLVYDMGAGSTTASVLRFQARRVKDVGKFNKTIQEVNVISSGWDKTLGGDALNELIVIDMIEKFVETRGPKSKGITTVAVGEHGRTMAKLWREAERLRQVLSANTATSASFESLYDDEDFKYKLTRADFERLANSYSERIGSPIESALQTAGLKVEDLNSVVLHGGAMRTPFVQKRLEALVGDAAKLRSNVNADEAASLGAAFKAAGLSPSFRVKDIKSSDASTYHATLSWTAKSGKKPRRQNIFLPTSAVGTTKHMPFNMSENFDLSVHHEIPDASSDTRSDRPIWQIKVNNLTESISELVSKHGCAKESIKTVLAVRLDPATGLPGIASGSSSCEVEDTDKKSGVIDGVKGLFGLGGDKDKGQKPLDDNGEEPSSIEEISTTSLPDASSATESPSSSSPSSPPSSSSSTSSPSSSASASSKTPKSKIITIPLSISHIRIDSRQPSPPALTAMKARLSAFDRSDAARRLREETFNGLEAFTYKARDVLSDNSFVGASSSEERTAIEQAVASAGEWLHSDDGSNAGTDELKSKLASLKEMIKPINKRRDEATKRPKAVKDLEHAINQTQTMLREVKAQLDKAESTRSLSQPPPSSSSSTSSSSAPDPLDELDDLDDPPSTASHTPSSSPSSPPIPYTPTDLTSLTTSQDEAKSWLSDQLAAQDALGPSDDPVLLSSDVSARAKTLNDLVARIALKGARSYQPPPPKGSKKSSAKGKGRGGKGDKASSSSSPSASPSSSSSSSLKSGSKAEERAEKGREGVKGNAGKHSEL